MNKFNLNNSNQIIGYALFIVTIVIVIYLYPSKVKFKYEFSIGKPWMHEKVIAPFDFSILKPLSDIKKEEEIIKKQHLPIFNYNEKVFDLKIEDFVILFEEKWANENNLNIDKEFTFLNLFKTSKNRVDNRKNKLVNKAYSILKSIYEKGIIQQNIDVLYKSNQYFLLKKGSIAEKSYVEDFYTLNSANNFINLIDELSESDYNFIVPLLIISLEPNIIYNQYASNNLLENDISSISKSEGLILKGQVIINKGEIVSDVKYQQLLSFKHKYEGEQSSYSSFLVLFGRTILVGLNLVILFYFLKIYRREIFENNSKIALILSMILLLVILSTIVLNLNVNYLYSLPFCILPIVIKTFFDFKVAIFTHFITILLIGFIAPNSFEFIFLQFITGVASVLSIIRMYTRAQLFSSVGKIILIYFLIYLSISFSHEGSLKSLDFLIIFQFIISGILTLFAYPMIYVFEKTFGIVSDISLLELADTNNPILRRLANEAPGTFQHSIQVANLSEEAILAIGGNTLLVRVGAIYHDIGKLNKPLFFIENQRSGINPHNDLKPEDSAEIIIQHISEGVDLARKYNLPEEIIDFIITHHGTTSVKYFYQQFMENSNNSNNLNKFSYPGPIPTTKEQAVLMIADSVEAASRSLKDKNHKKIDQLIDNIINQYIRDEQFVNASITFKDLNDIRILFKKQIKAIYHPRIEY